MSSRAASPRTSLPRLVAGLLLCLLSAVLAAPHACGQEPPGESDPVLAREEGGALEVRRSEVLATLQRLQGPAVLEEMILAALVEQDARAKGVPMPDESLLEWRYTQFVRDLALAQGAVPRLKGATPAEEIEDLLQQVDLESTFEEGGLTARVVKRRLRTEILTDAVLQRDVTLTPEDLEGRLDSLVAQIIGGPTRVVAVAMAKYVPGDEESRAKARAEAEALLATISAPEFVPDPNTMAELPLSEPDNDEPGHEMQRAAFAIEAVGGCAGPIEVEGKAFVVMRLMRIVEPGLPANAEGLTPEEIARAKERREASARAEALKLLRDRKVVAERPAYWARLRKEAGVEILWTPPTPTTP